MQTQTPLFRQVARLLEDGILDGEYTPGSAVPSSIWLSSFHGINPATARRGLNELIARGILIARRGQPAIVAPDAITALVASRKEELPAALAPLIDEATRVNMTQEELLELVSRVAESRGLYAVQG
ncbi:GntR family transcriptional regulator [Corynebacterium renale]|uniref:DNA-binding transcriptional regulator YhcF (GntR family) n=1 Tax=Corynebacterium renale TaxID=1724 RepID=A0A2A9DM20_9CORY|nr:GntR family transcriptional regulator [Corynebacterium renale]PFG27748.1 DNA-binding transcriptional regulator YhcF (GntR family) [Corynebacterium renale]SQG63531.1 GntR family transcriptional regulator [Corynebacterium renale]SQI22140.1 GntR family transcriptional regulator [Corynebacterium renale]